MCLAKLKVSTQPCQHRWYFQVQPCAVHKTIQACPKISLDGWEEKSISCPFCNQPGFFDVRYRLIGNDRNPHVGGLEKEENQVSQKVLSRSPSLNARRDMDEATRRAQRNKARNSRVNKMLTTGNGSPPKQPDSVMTGNGSPPKQPDSVMTGSGSPPKQLEPLTTGNGAPLKQLDSLTSGNESQPKRHDSLTESTYSGTFDHLSVYWTV